MSDTVMATVETNKIGGLTKIRSPHLARPSKKPNMSSALESALLCILFQNIQLSEPFTNGFHGLCFFLPAGSRAGGVL